jgi:hypothetical protein
MMGIAAQAAYRGKYSRGLEVPFQSAGAPTNNVTQLGRAVVGSVLVDVTNGQHYICTATNGTSTVTWTKTGTQT